MCGPPKPTVLDSSILHPLELLPPSSYTPSLARRVRRLVSSNNAKLKLSRLLERVATPSSSSPFADAYVIDRPATKDCRPGVSVLFATPMMQRDRQGFPPMIGTGNRRVVIKAVPKMESLKSIKRGDDPLHEVAAMQLLQEHPSVIPLLDCLQDDDYVYLVLPYLAGGDLFSRVEATQGKGLPEAEAATYLRQLAEGLLFMKTSCGLAHHDVSLENAMLTEEGGSTIQIIDLGMCLRVPQAASSKKQQHVPTYLTPQRCSGKPAYVAPEVVREEAFDPFAADVWSLGVCLYTMLMARPLYNSPHDQAFKMISKPGGVYDVAAIYEKYDLCLPPLAKDLVCSMLHADPCQRPTLEEVLRHPFLGTPPEQPCSQAKVVPSPRCPAEEGTCT